MVQIKAIHSILTMDQQQRHSTGVPAAAIVRLSCVRLYSLTHILAIHDSGFVLASALLLLFVGAHHAIIASRLVMSSHSFAAVFLVALLAAGVRCVLCSTPLAVSLFPIEEYPSGVCAQGAFDMSALTNYTLIWHDDSTNEDKTYLIRPCSNVPCSCSPASLRRRPTSLCRYTYGAGYTCMLPYNPSTPYFMRPVSGGGVYTYTHYRERTRNDSTEATDHSVSAEEEAEEADSLLSVHFHCDPTVDVAEVRTMEKSSVEPQWYVFHVHTPHACQPSPGPVPAADLSVRHCVSERVRE